MKRIVVFALILNAALLGVIAQQFIALAGDDGPLATRQNGDVNGDQVLDMSDAVYLLIHLFNGGPEPVALADSPEVLDRLDTLEATQGALQQGLSDLEADLPELTNDYVMYAKDLMGHGVYNRLRSDESCGTPRADETWFETNGFLRGGILSEEDGRIYFTTTRESDLLIEGVLSDRDVWGNGLNQIISIRGLGIPRLGWIAHSPAARGNDPLSIVPLVFEDVPAGEYYLEFGTAVEVSDNNWCRELEPGPFFTRYQIPWLSIKYLR